jgi:hypothetical protein
MGGAGRAGTTNVSGCPLVHEQQPLVVVAEEHYALSSQTLRLPTLTDHMAESMGGRAIRSHLVAFEGRTRV